MKIQSVSLLLLPVMTFAISHSALASKDRGGGDPCQNRIEEVRNYIGDWIQNGGAKDLKFEGTGISLEDYKLRMMTQIDLTKKNYSSSISCTSNPDEVKVDGVRKTCAADYSDPLHPTILCYSLEKNGEYVDGFMALPSKDQYFQVHHEFAVLARIEDQAGQDSNYLLSKQITDDVRKKIIDVISVRPAGNLTVTTGVSSDLTLDFSVSPYFYMTWNISPDSPAYCSNRYRMFTQYDGVVKYAEQGEEVEAKVAHFYLNQFTHNAELKSGLKPLGSNDKWCRIVMSFSDNNHKLIMTDKYDQNESIVPFMGAYEIFVPSIY